MCDEEEVGDRTPEMGGDNSADLVMLELWRVEFGSDSLLDLVRAKMLFV